MFYGLINLSWFDWISISLTLAIIILVQVLNAFWPTTNDQTTDDVVPLTTELRKSLKANELKSLISNDSTTNDFNTTTSDKLPKQQSEPTEKYVNEICLKQNIRKKRKNHKTKHVCIS